MRQLLSGIGRRSRDGLASLIEDTPMTGAEEDALLGLPMDTATEMRAGGAIGLESGSAAPDQDGIAIQIQKATDSSFFKLVGPTGKKEAPTRLQLLWQQEQQTLHSHGPVSQEQSTTHQRGGKKIPP